MIDLQSKILDEQDHARLLDVETDFYNGKYGDPNTPEARRKLNRVQEGIRMDANARHRAEAEEAAQSGVTNAEKELSKAVESLNQIKSRLNVLENTPILSWDELKQIEGEISKIEKGKITLPDWEKLYAARKQRDSSDQALKEAGYDITTETARESAYKANDEALRKAREEQTKALEAQYKAEDDLEQATKELAERRALNAAQSARDAAQQRNTEARQKNAQRQEEEKAIQDARKKEEARQKALDAAMKKAARDSVKQQEKLIKNAPFEGMPQHPTPQQQKRVEAVQKAWEVGKKRLLEGIGGDDNTLDASEINAGINEALQAIRKQGESTERFMDAVTNNFYNLAKQVNNNAQQTEASMRKRFRAMDEAVKSLGKQQENLRKGLNHVATWI